MEYAGLPHRLTQDDTYRGYYIPDGSVIWPNIWGMCHDERHFPSPFEFEPERYLESKQNADSQWTLRSLSFAEDPVKIAFGFGRRSETFRIPRIPLNLYFDIDDLEYALASISRKITYSSSSPAYFPFCKSTRCETWMARRLSLGCITMASYRECPP
jgi:hypothetical protein